MDVTKLMIRTVGSAALPTPLRAAAGEELASASNGTWDKKINAILLHSPLNLNRPFKEIALWTEETIEKRSGTLFESALRSRGRPES